MDNILHQMRSTGNLIPVDRKVVENLPIPESTASFMMTFGLPKLEILLCGFRFEGYEIYDDCVVIGDDGGGRICVHSDGTIYCHYGESVSHRFINSGLREFVSLLFHYYQDYQSINSDDDSVYDRAIPIVRKRIMDIDNVSLETVDNWWSLVLEQMELGQL